MEYAFFQMMSLLVFVIQIIRIEVRHPLVYYNHKIKHGILVKNNYEIY